MIYIIIFFLLVLGIYLFDYKRKKCGKNFFYLFCEIIMILVAGFRYRIGLDTHRYMEHHIFVKDLSLISLTDLLGQNYDPLYILLSSVAKTLGEDFWILQLLQAILVNVTVFWFINKYTKNIFTGVWFYYVLLYINFMSEVMREACAVSLFLIAVPYYEKSKWLRYYLLAFLSYLFHASAVITLFLPFLKWLNIRKVLIINKKYVITLIILYFISSFISSYLFEYLSFLDLSNSINNKISRYIDNRLASQVLNIWGIIFNILKNIIPGLFSVLYMKKNAYKIYNEEFVSLCFIFTILSIPIAIFYRYNNYFMLFNIIVLAQISFYSLKTRFFKNSFVQWIVFASFFTLMILRVYIRTIDEVYDIKEYMRYYPYSSIFDKTLSEDRERLFGYYDN